MFKGPVLSEISLLDEKYYFCFAESEFYLRAVRKGLKLLYYHGSRIVHTGGLIAEGNWQRTTGNHFDYFTYYFTKNFGSGVCRAAQAPSFSALSSAPRASGWEGGRNMGNSSTI